MKDAIPNSQKVCTIDYAAKDVAASVLPSAVTSLDEPVMLGADHSTGSFGLDADDYSKAGMSGI